MARVNEMRARARAARTHLVDRLRFDLVELLLGHALGVRPEDLLRDAAVGAARTSRKSRRHVDRDGLAHIFARGHGRSPCEAGGEQADDSERRVEIVPEDAGERDAEQAVRREEQQTAVVQRRERLVESWERIVAAEDHRDDEPARHHERVGLEAVARALELAAPLLERGHRALEADRDLVDRRDGAGRDVLDRVLEERVEQRADFVELVEVG